MLAIAMLPAREGDCLILSWGSDAHPHRILFDGGRKATFADLKQHIDLLPATQREFELLVVTHIDRDHIEGVIELLIDPQCPVTFKDVWFNGYHHLADEDLEIFGAVMGESLTERLRTLCRSGGWTWNGAFGAKARKAAALPPSGAPVTLALQGLDLTLLSPSRTRLERLLPVWEQECEKAGIVAGKVGEPPEPEDVESFGTIDIEELAAEPFEEDDAKANGSSIAVLAAYGGRRVLLSGDAFSSDLLHALEKLPAAARKLDAFKVPHHGSRKNLSKELLEAIQCKNYLFSTNGSYFGHPDPVAVSRTIRWGGPGAELWFNYSSAETLVWDVDDWKADFDYSTHYPEQVDGYQEIRLETGGA